MGLTEISGASSFAELAQRVYQACVNGAVINCVLGVEVEFPVLDDVFLSSYIETARDWQNPTRPSNLHFNHGEYINRHGDGIEFLIDQLRKRPTGNRACLSLTDTSDLMESGDEPKPSFMVLQVGFSEGERSTLHMSAYFRALEVSRFLPMNLAEMAIIATRIQEEILDVDRLNLAIMAFRAYCSPGFSRLEKSEIDIVEVEEIYKIVERRDVDSIRALISSKLAPDSVVVLDGLAYLQTTLSESEWCSVKVTIALDKALSAMTQLRSARVSGSHAGTISRLEQSVTKELQTAIDYLAEGL